MNLTQLKANVLNQINAISQLGQASPASAGKEKIDETMTDDGSLFKNKAVQMSTFTASTAGDIKTTASAAGDTISSSSNKLDFGSVSTVDASSIGSGSANTGDISGGLKVGNQANKSSTSAKNQTKNAEGQQKVASQVTTGANDGAVQMGLVENEAKINAAKMEEISANSMANVEASVEELETLSASWQEKMDEVAAADEEIQGLETENAELKARIAELEGEDGEGGKAGKAGGAGKADKGGEASEAKKYSTFKLATAAQEENDAKTGKSKGKTQAGGAQGGADKADNKKDSGKQAELAKLKAKVAANDAKIAEETETKEAAQEEADGIMEEAAPMQESINQELEINANEVTTVEAANLGGTSKQEYEQKRIEEFKKSTDTVAKVGDVTSTVGQVTEKVGQVASKIGDSLTTAGVALQTSGTTLIETGTPLLSNPYTAAAGAAMVSSGTTMVSTGTTKEGVGQTVSSIGKVTQTVGKVTQIAGSATSSAAKIAEGAVTGDTSALISGIQGVASAALSAASLGMQIKGVDSKMANLAINAAQGGVSTAGSVAQKAAADDKGGAKESNPASLQTDTKQVNTQTLQTLKGPKDTSSSAADSQKTTQNTDTQKSNNTPKTTKTPTTKSTQTPQSQGANGSKGKISLADAYQKGYTPVTNGAGQKGNLEKNLAVINQLKSEGYDVSILEQDYQTRFSKLDQSDKDYMNKKYGNKLPGAKGAAQA